MMEFEVSYSLDNEQQFWDELDDIVSLHSREHELIDNALRTYVSFASTYKGEYLRTPYDVARCTYKLVDSSLYSSEPDYVRRQLLYVLLQEDGPATLHLIAAFLLYDGRQNEETFELMNDVGAFARLIELVQTVQEQDEGLHRLLLELFYEMGRIQRLKRQELLLMDDAFILGLLQLIENVSDDVDDPYHYYVIRVLLVLNEQYMVCAHDPDSSRLSQVPNLVISCLSDYGAVYKTFGENIILLLNRESETSLQLLILKLLYLLFTTAATQEYFYTNDLRVLVDVMIRNLLDLAFSSTALRHTYLRVLYPLLSHTQLRLRENHYKRDELLKLMYVMGSGNAGMLHFGSMDETTKRLVARCQKVPWIKGPDEGDESNGSGSGASDTEAGPPRAPRSSYLGIGVNSDASKSNLSIAAITTPRAKPGTRTVSREEELAAMRQRKYSRAKGNSMDVAANCIIRVTAPTNSEPMPKLKNPFQTEVEG